MRRRCRADCLERLHRRDGEFIDPDIRRIVRVALDPVPGDLWVRPPLELAPQVLVLHRLVVGGAPAAALPVGHPLRDALPHILRIGVEIDGAGALECVQALDRGPQLHAVVGGVCLAAGNFLLRFP